LSGRLLGVSVALLLGLGLVGGLVLERNLRAELIEATDDTLRSHAQVGASLVAQQDPTQIDALSDLLGDASETRMSVVDGTGRVLGDSQIDQADLATLEDHSHRPEVVAALAGQMGEDSRESATLGVAMRYQAVPAVLADGTPVAVRVAQPLSQVEEAVRAQRWMLALSGLVGLAAAVLMTAFATRAFGNQLETLVLSARRSLDDQDHTPIDRENAGPALERVVDSLRQERDRFEAVLEGMDDAVIAVDIEGNVRVVNGAAARMLRLTPDAVGTPVLDSLPLPEVEGLMQRAAEGRSGATDLELPGAVQVEARSTPANGGVVLVFQDVTRLRRLESLRKDFVGNVSHELRTPVSVIRLNAEILIDDALEDGIETSRPFVAAILRNADRLTALITDLLQISRIESGKVPVRMVNLRLLDVVDQATEGILAAADSKGIELELEIDTALTVRADSEALCQVLINLLDNAVKYTPAGGHVLLRASHQDGGVRIEVEDDGPGIAEEHHERIFERFYRVDAGRSRAVGGTGLGLAIVKHMVKAMDGNVGVENAPRGGSRFYVELTVPSA
jgi:two-component system phosphate regulon sensor histidine kinase PhoR